MRQQNSDMDKMQQEAVRRMQEMQSRAKYPQNMSKKNTSMPKKPLTESADKVESKGFSQSTQKEVCPADKEKPACKNTQRDFLGQLLRDNDMGLILLLLIILGNEKVDTGLMLALLYIIM